jgi:hypothetical protein
LNPASLWLSPSWWMPFLVWGPLCLAKGKVNWH